MLGMLEKVMSYKALNCYSRFNVDAIASRAVEGEGGDGGDDVVRS